MRDMDLKRIILKSLLKHKFRTAVALAVIIGSIILEVLPPLILARAVDAVTDNKELSVIMACGYFAVLACSGAADAVREALIVASGEGITHSIRTAMMAKLRRLPAGYFTENEAGKTASVQVNDVDAIEEMFSSGIVSMFTDLGTVAAILAVVFRKGTGLGLLLLAVLPLLALFTAHVQKKMLAAHTENRKATADASGILPETMRVIRSLHVYRAEAFAQKRYGAAVRHSFQAIGRTNYYDAVYSPVIITVSAAVIAVIMSLSGQSGAFRSWFGMSVGTAVAVISYVNNIFTPLSSIGMEIQTVQSAAAGWKRVQAFLHEREEEPVSEAAEKTDADVPFAVEIRDAGFSYDGEHRIFDHLSLQVKKGEFVTLTGRTGAGKSTLFKLLLGLYGPDSGSIRVNGVDPRAFGGEKRRRTVCCVEQKEVPVPGTVRDQVTLGNAGFSDAEIRTALETAGLADQIARLQDGLDTPYSEAAFSQGQKQMLMIARAIVSDPEILLLDEITAGLDSATEKAVLDALKKASGGRTVLSISHRLSAVMPGRTVRIGPGAAESSAEAADL